MPSLLSGLLPTSSDLIAPIPSAPVPDDHRSFTDIPRIRTNIYDNVRNAVNSIGALENSRHTLSLSNVDYVDPADVPISKQKKAILGGKTLYRRLRGTWNLHDNATGTLLDSKEATIAQVPYLSNRGTFVLNGTEYTLSNQMRLRPGIFTRVKENGEVESHVNVMPGNGVSHRYFLDPETGVFKINIGQAKLPLLPILRAFGSTDKELREHWGDELFNANNAVSQAHTVAKLYSRLVRKPDPNASEEVKAKTLVDMLTAMKLDPHITKTTLGHPHAALSKEAILATTKKLLRVSRQEELPDDRDNLAFQSFFGPEDLLAERITRDKSFLRQLLWKASMNGNLSSIPSGALTRQLHTTILGTGLGQAAEEINPAELLDASTRSTRLGAGGIASLDAIPDEARAVQPSQLGILDIIKTAESEKVGVDTRLTSTARKGRDGNIYIPLIDVKTGKQVYTTPRTISESVMAFPGEMAKNTDYVAAIADGTTKFVPRTFVNYELPHMENAFSPLSNMIPLKSVLKGQRMSMGARYLAQSLPLTTREAPLLQSAMPGQHMARSFEDEYGKHLGAVSADSGGIVKKVSADEVVVKQDDGKLRSYELYNHFPYARKTFSHNEALVKAGQRVDPGQLLAKSNYTDDKGTAALGLNAKVAFMPFRGANYEDAVVISESFAKRMRSEHMYQHDQEWNANIRKGLKPFVSLFPNAYSKEQLSKMDEHGVLKPGTVVNFGDPLIVVAEEKPQTYSQIHRSRRPVYTNNSVVWDQHKPGIVTDVEHTSNGVAVAVKSYSDMHVGDKLSNRWGGKGVVAEIVPDDKMLHDEKGEPYEIALNPEGMISRINPVQVAEMVLGKISKLTGKTYKLEDFANIGDLRDFVAAEMKRHNVKDLESITDPDTGRKIPNVLAGYQYLLKLHHTAGSKGQGRSMGGYTSEEIPAKGGPEGSKKIALLESSGLLSHGAVEVLRDAHLVRGQKNEAYWRSFMSGFRPEEPNIPLVYRKFVDSLRASGINVVRTGRKLHVMALTKADVDKLAEDRNLENSDTVDWKEGLRPRTGGLFDMSMTGGHQGNRWAAIKLAEPLPNPVFEEPIMRLLGLTEKKFEDVIAGKAQLGGNGTGPAAIQKALEAIDVDKEMNVARSEVAGSKRGARDMAIRKLAYLKSAKRLGLHPKDWVLDRVPVLPPIYRPVSVMQGSGGQLIADPNFLYKELFDTNQLIDELKNRNIDTASAKSDLYKAFKAVAGLGDPIGAKNRERKVEGILSHVLGGGPKLSVMQRQLLGATVDVVGRAVVIPDPELNMDEVGIPENKAWEVYKPFIIRNLVRNGLSRIDAVRAYKDQSKLAKDVLLQELRERPVVISRAPVLHRYGIMGALPKLVKGDVMHIPTSVVTGYGADFDGDLSNSLVYVALRRHAYDYMISEESKKSFWEPRRMAARFKTALHYKSGFEYFCVHLEDFPHLPDCITKEHIDFHPVPAGLHVFAYDEKTSSPVLAEVTSWSVHRDREIVTIDLKSGRQIISDDDPRAVYGLDRATWEFKRARPSEAIGLFVPRVDRLPEMGTELTVVPIQSEGRLKPQAQLNYNFGWLLGALAGYGWVSHCHGNVKAVCMAGIDPGVQQMLSTALTEVFNETPKISFVEGSRSYGESMKMTITSKEFGLFVEPLIGTGAKNKHLPPYYLSGNREFRLGLLAGLIDTDGSVSISNAKAKPQYMVNMTSVSLRLLQETQHLVRSLGIRSRISSSETPAGEKAWVITFNAADVRRTRIKLHHGAKAAKLAAYTLPIEASTNDDRRVVLPIPVSICRDVMALADRGNKAESNLYTACSIAASGGTISRACALNLLHLFGDRIKDPLFPSFRAMAENTEVCWDEVVSYENSGIKETGWDLTVPGYETFMSVDGVILSNTMNYHVPATEEARKEVLEKMLPSKNLFAVSNFKVHYLPRHEYLGGLYHASTAVNDTARPAIFATKADAIAAYREGRISMDTPIKVLADK